MSLLKPTTIRERDQLTGWLLCLPALIVLVLVFAYPIARAFGQSLYVENLGTQLEPVFTGLGNYSRMLGDGRFWQSLSNTAVFTIASLTLELLFGIGVAVVLDQQFRARGIVRTIGILPWALPTAVMGLAWEWIFNDQYGVANDVLRLFGADPITWLGEPGYAMVALIVADVWKTTPFIAVILLAGLQAIPQDLYEAHSIDGATPWKNFLQISLPLVTPQIAIALLFRFAEAFGIFELVLVMTGGGPAGSTETVSLYIYDTAMRYLDFGYSAALIVVTFLILLVVVFTTALALSQTRANITGD